LHFETPAGGPACCLRNVRGVAKDRVMLAAGHLAVRH
jgi:hypothetical protein